MNRFPAHTHHLAALLLGWLLLTADSTRALELHVAPEGNDTWSGKLIHPNAAHSDGPLATLTGARDAIRQLKQQGLLTEPVTVVIADGSYAIRAPLELMPEDSGTEKAPITYAAAKEAHPVFSGGQVIHGWQPGTNGIWQTQLPDVAAGHWYFEQLWVNGRRAIRARTPNQFYFFPRAASANETNPAGHIRPEDFQALAGLAPAELKDVNWVTYQKWNVVRRFIGQVDETKKSITASGPAMAGWNPWADDSRFIFENALRFLDAPGEWFLSRTGTLYYQPLPGENLNDVEVIAPVTDKFIIIRGEPASGKFVEHVTFEGLAFQHSQWLMPPNGFGPDQAASTIEAVVLADGARHIHFDDCEFSHLGTYGIWFRRGCRDDVIRHCLLEDMGAGGVRIGEMKLPTDENASTSHITVDNNIVRHGGLIFPCAVGVWIGFGSDNQITHNEIADFFYTGISVGWRWGYGRSNAERNNISFNHVHHLGQELLSDMGGIYTLGPSAGTVVRNNVFHDIVSYAYGGWGLYTDEGSSGILFENNLVYDTRSSSFHQHYGRENIFRNNILADSTGNQLQVTRAENHLSFTFENNIVYWTNNTTALGGNWLKNRQLTYSNCYWNAAGHSVSFNGKSLAEWQHTPVDPPTNAAVNPAWAVAGRELGSVIADPLFVNAAQHDFHLQTNSPALTLGFQPFDYSQAGVYGEAAWRAKAQAEAYPPIVIPPAPFLTGIRDDFESETVGQPPKDFAIFVGGGGDSIAVTDETAATGRHSLKITDAPGLAQTWLPHLSATMNYRTGKIRNTFALRLEPGANVNFEWRDWSQTDYPVGPQFRINNGQLIAVAKQLMAIPEHQWVQFEVTTDLGQASTGTWSLKVTLPHQASSEFKDIPCGSAKFKSLTWIGFISDADDKTVFYLDDFTLDATR